MTYIRVADLRVAYLLLVRYITTNIRVEHMRVADTRVAHLRAAQIRVAHFRAAHRRRITDPQRLQRSAVAITSLMPRAYDRDYKHVPVVLTH